MGAAIVVILEVLSMNCGFLTSYSATVRLSFQPIDKAEVQPDDFLKASGEIFAFTLVFTWILSLIFNFRVFLNNHLRDVVGYNSPCVGWDEPPAIYFGLLGMVMMAVF